MKRSKNRSSPEANTSRRALLFVAAIALVTFPVAPALAQTYVGSAECIDCHEDQAATLAKTHHGKAAFEKRSEHGCETCHGPGSLHVDDPEVEANRPRLSDKTAEELATMCQGCHSGGKQAFWNGSMHDERGISCVDCHSVHSYQSRDAQLKQPTTKETCFECHKEIRAQAQRTSHHPVREGKMGCEDCHNPHGTVTDSLISAASVNEKCYECHTEKRGPFLWEHPPVRENCLDCHTPHGSNHAKLQKTAIPYVCQQCHSNTRHPGSLYDASRLFEASGDPNASPSNRVFNRACLNCHANIHGINHPSAPYFWR